MELNLGSIHPHPNYLAPFSNLKGFQSLFFFLKKKYALKKEEVLQTHLNNLHS